MSLPVGKPALLDATQPQRKEFASFLIDMQNRDTKTLSENFTDMDFGFGSLPPSPRPEKQRRMSLYGTSVQLDDHTQDIVSVEMTAPLQGVADSSRPDSAEADAEQPRTPLTVSV